MSKVPMNRQVCVNSENNNKISIPRRKSLFSDLLERKFGGMKKTGDVMRYNEGQSIEDCERTEIKQLKAALFTEFKKYFGPTRAMKWKLQAQFYERKHENMSRP